MVNICTVVPAGVVCFFPSYDYEEKVYTTWSEKGFLQRIESRKRVCINHSRIPLSLCRSV